MLQLTVLIALSVWAGIQNFVYMSYLPERVAIHFGPDGVADNWMDRGKATWLMITIQVILPWVLVAIARCIRYIPPALVNIPHREYWLQPERRESTLAYVSGLVVSIAIAESMFISVVNHLSFTANRSGQPLNTQMLLLALGIFLAATLFLVVSMFRRFSLPRNASPQAR